MKQKEIACLFLFSTFLIIVTAVLMLLLNIEDILNSDPF